MLTERDDGSVGGVRVVPDQESQSYLIQKRARRWFGWGSWETVYVVTSLAVTSATSLRDLRRLVVQQLARLGEWEVACAVWDWLAPSLPPLDRRNGELPPEMPCAECGRGLGIRAFDSTWAANVCSFRCALAAIEREPKEISA